MNSYHSLPPLSGRQPRTAAMLSILPGLGQLYLGDKRKGILFLDVGIANYLLLAFALSTRSVADVLHRLSVEYRFMPNAELIDLLMNTHFGSPAVWFLLAGIVAFIWYAACDAYDRAHGVRRRELYGSSFLDMSEAASGSYVAHIAVMLSCLLLAAMFVRSPALPKQITVISMELDQSEKRSLIVPKTHLIAEKNVENAARRRVMEPARVSETAASSAKQTAKSTSAAHHSAKSALTSTHAAAETSPTPAHEAGQTAPKPRQEAVLKAPTPVPLPPQRSAASPSTPLPTPVRTSGAQNGASAALPSPSTITPSPSRALVPPSAVASVTPLGFLSVPGKVIMQSARHGSEPSMAQPTLISSSSVSGSSMYTPQASSVAMSSPRSDFSPSAPSTTHGSSRGDGAAAAPMPTTNTFSDGGESAPSTVPVHSHQSGRGGGNRSGSGIPQPSRASNFPPGGGGLSGGPRLIAVTPNVGISGPLPGAGEGPANPTANASGDRPRAATREANVEADFGPFMRSLQRLIKKHWYPPKVNESKRFRVTFKIAKSGALSDLKVSDSSGIASADMAGLKAVEGAAPEIPPLPQFAPSSVDIEFTFDYNLFTKY